MSRRLRVPLQPWLARASSTRSRPALPSPLQRELFRRVAQPVAVITARIPSSLQAGAPRPGGTGEQDEPLRHNHGATLSSLSSISLSPPLVAFSLRLPSRLASFLSAPAPAPFTVHLLSTAQEPLARAFARQAPLPAKAQPSPPPSPSPSPAGNPDPPTAVAAPHFAPELFDQLEEGGLGALDCRVVRRVPLSSLGAGDDGALEREDGAAASEHQPRSELFIARVEGVRLGTGAGAEGAGEASLLYWDQRYAGVRALEAEEGAAEGR
ncbi:hypothetical protein JCM10450v2_005476 [Rhodotorula kratochvilovae]